MAVARISVSCLVITIPKSVVPVPLPISFPFMMHLEGGGGGEVSFVHVDLKKRQTKKHTHTTPITHQQILCFIWLHFYKRNMRRDAPVTRLEITKHISAPSSASCTSHRCFHPHQLPHFLKHFFKEKKMFFLNDIFRCILFSPFTSSSLRMGAQSTCTVGVSDFFFLPFHSTPPPPPPPSAQACGCKCSNLSLPLSTLCFGAGLNERNEF